MSKLLINEHPLMVLPTLAKTIGLNEAIILQQIHYWLDRRTNKNFKDGLFWVFNTYEEWVNQFPFWSKDTVKRTIKSLENQQLIISKNHNKDKFNKTKWYTIDYFKLTEIEKIINNEIKPIEECKLHHSNHREMVSFDKSKMHQPYDSNMSIPEKGTLPQSIYIDTENTSENTSHSKDTFIQKKSEKEIEMLAIWNDIIDKNIKPRLLTEKREIKLKWVLNTFFENNLENWKVFCIKIKSSEFLMGNVTKFKVTIDWVLDEDKIQKIIEGDYGVELKEKNSQLESLNHIETKIEMLNESSLSKKLRKNLLDIIGPSKYSSWFKNVLFFESNDKIIIISDNNFIKNYINNNFMDILNRILRKLNVKKVCTIE